MSSERQIPVSRSVRPVHPERPCLNCGDATYGEFCPACGQRKVDVQVSLPVMVKEVLEDEFLLNRRLPFTIFALLFRPGYLTAEVLQGHVARWIRPFRLYLMSSVIFFLLLSFVSLRAIEGVDFSESNVQPDSVQRADMGIAALDSALADIDTRLEAPDVTAATAIALGTVRSNLDRQRERLLAGADSVDGGAVRRDSVGGDSVRANATAPGSAAADSTDAPAGDDEPAGSGGWMNMQQLNTGSARVDSVLRVRLDRWGAMEREEAFQDVSRTFLGYVPTILFLVLPLFAAALKLLYVRQRRYYAEHLIFVLHAHAFVFVIFSLMLLMREWIVGWPMLLLVSWVFVYIYLAMRRVYGQSRLKTFLKYWTLGWMYFWILLVAVPLFLIASILLLPA